VRVGSSVGVLISVGATVWGVETQRQDARVINLAGIGQGFRDTNEWLRMLTRNAFPATFYVGDALGSFNSLMRLFSGLLAGLGIVWFVLPHIFQVQAYNQQLDECNHVKVIEQIQGQNPRPFGG
jgi:hypothetical protein